MTHADDRILEELSSWESFSPLMARSYPISYMSNESVFQIFIYFYTLETNKYLVKSLEYSKAIWILALFLTYCLLQVIFWSSIELSLLSEAELRERGGIEELLVTSAFPS